MLRKYKAPSSDDVAAFGRALRRISEPARVVILLALHTGLRADRLLTLTRAEVRIFRSSAATRALELPAHLPHEKSIKVSRREWLLLGGLLAGPTSSLATRRNMFVRHIKATARMAGLDVKLWSPRTLKRVADEHRYGSALP